MFAVVVDLDAIGGGRAASIRTMDSNSTADGLTFEGETGNCFRASRLVFGSAP